MILIRPFPIRNTPELSRQIGYLASQQRRAYNQAVEWLNREPDLQRLKTGRVPHHRTLNGRLTQLREADPTWRAAPRRIHDAGVRLAVQAQQRFRMNRDRRLAEMAALEDRRHEWAAQPPANRQQLRQLEREEARLALLSRPHRRTLAFRTRKHGTQTLDIDNNQMLRTTRDRMSVWVGSPRSWGFRVPLRRPIPQGAELRSLRLVELRRNRSDVSNRTLADVRYEAHLALDWPEPPPAPEPESEAEVVGVDTSERLVWTDSRGEIWQNDGPRSCQCQGQHRTHCPYGLPTKLQRQIGGKLGGRRRGRASHRRRKLERRRREVLRKRTADRDRAWNQLARAFLDRIPPVRLLAVQGLRPTHQSRRGTASAPGRGVAEQAQRNRALAEAAPSRTITILQHQAERHGIPVAVIWARTRDVCGTCGMQNLESRKNQARFNCQGCGWSGDPAQNAALVLASRAHRQRVGSRANLDSPNGRETDPSGRRFGDGETHPTPDAAGRGTDPPGSATGSAAKGRSSTEASKLHPG